MKQIGRYLGKKLRDNPKCNLDIIKLKNFLYMANIFILCILQKRKEKDVDPNGTTKTLMSFDK